MIARTHPIWPRLRLLALLAPGLGVILVLIGAVAWIALAQSFGLHNPIGEDRLTLDHWEKMLDRRLFLRAVGYSLWLGFAAALISVALAYPLAIWLRRPFRGSALVSAVLQAPLLVHGLVAAFLFVNIIAYHGLVNQLMIALGVWAEPRQLQNDRNAMGVLILQVWKNLPFALLVLSGYLAEEGRGATKNGIRLAVSENPPDCSAVELGWSSRVSRSAYTAALHRLLDAGANVRRHGSGALALAWVAEGRTDGYAELHMNSWDSLAGLLMVREAGGVTTEGADYGERLFKGGAVFAANVLLAPLMTEHFAAEPVSTV